ncbi:MAG: thioredoxin domain-containing protein [Glycocaulis sp.]
MALSLTRRTFPALAAGVALLLAACGGSGNGAQGQSAFEREGDMAKGSPDAPVVMIEYLSLSCGGCAAFHANVHSTLNRYVEDGTLRLVYRQMLYPVPEISTASFMLARCVPEERYFDMVGLLLEQQNAIFQAAQRGALVEHYRTIARSAGLDDQQFRACMSDETSVDAIRTSTQQAGADGVSVTPSFFINGVHLQVNRAPDGSGATVYFAGNEAIQDDRGYVPAEYTGDTFSRIIEYFRSRAEQ